MDLSTHPLYADEALVRAMTAWHMGQGRLVYQLFQFPGSEADHAARLLAMSAPPQGASVLSLGCGVGGMERYWQESRPDLSFELVNISAAQMESCICEGRQVIADACGYISTSGPFDVVVMTYMLGYVDVQATFASALRNVAPGGVLLVADVFDSTAQFDAALAYESPSLAAVMAAAQACGASVESLGEGLAPTEFTAQALSPEILAGTTPAVLLMRAAQ